MRVLRRLLCFFAFLLNVASLCTSASGAAGLPEAATESRCPSGSSKPDCPPGGPAPAVQPPGTLPAAVSTPSPRAGGKDCTSDMTDPLCTASDSEHEAAPTDDCVTSSDKKSCPNNDADTQENCRDDSGGACTQTEIIPAPEQSGKSPVKNGDENPHDRLDENSIPGADGHSNSGPGNKADAGSAAGTGGVAAGRTSHSEAPIPAAPAPSTAGNSDAPSANPQHTNNEASETGPSPTTPSSSSSATASDGGSTTASNETDNTSSGSESTTNQEGVASNTDTTTTTTTTTTTLPPELTNNKKGDADSSSSISSSVWVRVPLLIVVTLACILVC
ncbi:uncharacterized protein TM35_000641260 [Trypanosoma theileri]|uniref:Uncharacterized protein n=1 Tax=Trypanosoma theileri TaxID=67003 RepID=A0A1X0NFR9_9TRYP|nr:uncharacterized protein TM35_000641260 [Trypanosoma theileri]ORC83594.1 hypothetical protein TM35_000641260 [Trypanosoma theileri]